MAVATELSRALLVTEGGLTRLLYDSEILHATGKETKESEPK